MNDLSTFVPASERIIPSSAVPDLLEMEGCSGPVRESPLIVCRQLLRWTVTLPAPDAAAH